MLRLCQQEFVTFQWLWWVLWPTVELVLCCVMKLQFQVFPTSQSKMGKWLKFGFRVVSVILDLGAKGDLEWSLRPTANVNCITWPCFLFTCRLPYITSTQKLIVSRQFYSQEFFKPFLFADFPFWEFLNLNLSFTARVNVVLNRTVVVDSDWCFENKRATRNGDVNNHIADYHLQMKNHIDWDSATCITYSTDYYQRLTLRKLVY